MLTLLLEEFFRNAFKSAIKGEFQFIYDRIGDTATFTGSTMGKSLTDFSPDIYNMMKTISDVAIMPIALIIITYVICYDLIQMILDFNNFHQFSFMVLFKWLVKSAIGIFFVSHCFEIMMAILDLGQWATTKAMGVITSQSTQLPVEELDKMLDSYDLGRLLLMMIVGFAMMLFSWILIAVSYVIVMVRFVEVYIYTAMAPIPLATLSHKEESQMGKNYLRSVFALGLQGVIMMLIYGIFKALVNLAASDPWLWMWQLFVYLLILVFMLFKSSAIAKSIVNAH